MTLHPDALLMSYAEALTLLGSARAQQLTLQFGAILAQKCERTKDCNGYPRKHGDGWKCSTCQKPWSTETAELGRNEEGERSTQRWRESHLHARLIDAAWIFARVEREMPWPYTAWCTHLLHPGPSLDTLEASRKRTPTLGVAQDQVAPCMLALEQRGILCGVPKPISFYRVKSWIRQARDRTRELAMIRGV